jgi:predicted ATPase
MASPAGTPFVGRRGELGRLRSLVDNLALGQGMAVVVQGEAGIGKSRLLEESLSNAPELGLRVHRGWREALALSGSHSAEAMVSEVEDRCAEAPVILVLDDLHCADAETMLAAYRLSRAIDDLPLLVIGACRPTR